jgi:hypothetical protein
MRRQVREHAETAIAGARVPCGRRTDGERRGEGRRDRLNAKEPSHADLLMYPVRRRNRRNARTYARPAG